MTDGQTDRWAIAYSMLCILCCCVLQTKNKIWISCNSHNRLTQIRSPTLCMASR